MSEKLDFFRESRDFIETTHPLQIAVFLLETGWKEEYDWQCSHFEKWLQTASPTSRFQQKDYTALCTFIVNPTECVRLLHKNYKLDSIKADTGEECLALAHANKIRNWFRLLLKLFDLGVGPKTWRQFRNLLETRLGLSCLNRFS